MALTVARWRVLMVCLTSSPGQCAHFNSASMWAFLSVVVVVACCVKRIIINNNLNCTTSASTKKY